MRADVKVDAPELRLDPGIVTTTIDWGAIFGSPGRVEVEIGIGKGRFLLTAAEARPDVHFLGVDWANEYLRVAESRAAKRRLANVRFLRVDARDLVRAIPDRAVGAYYVFYPDPWPKTRQQKRRFLQAATAAELARTLVPRGWLHVATDHPQYWAAIEGVLDRAPEFERLATFGGDEFPVPVDTPLTNFEEKYLLAGRKRFRASWRRR
jgi:tRNA (guanine-N7-)-methyltransferase